jgi:hypothetical protein
VVQIQFLHVVVLGPHVGAQLPTHKINKDSKPSLSYLCHLSPSIAIAIVGLYYFGGVVNPGPQHMDQHSFGCPGSGFVLGMRIRIQIQEHVN